jgi:hypothetical protein
MFDTDKLAPSQSAAVLAPHKSPLRGLGDSEVAPTPVGYSEAFMLGRDSERGIAGDCARRAAIQATRAEA